jgi:hypothetical protein
MINFIIIIFFILFLFSFIVGTFVGYKLLHPYRFPVLQTFQEQYERGEIPEAFLKSEQHVFRIPSLYGYDIVGFYFSGQAKKTIIFCHGIAWTRYGMAKYLKPFFEEGWNIVLYDHRACGETGGKYPSFGFYEKKDLQTVVEFARKKFPNSQVLGLFGESLGGAVVMQYACLDKKIDFVVSLCAFTSLRDLVRFHLKLVFIPKFLHTIVLFFTNWYVWFFANFQISDIEPRDCILKSQVPLFLVHGTGDKLVPHWMTEELYIKRKELAFTKFLSIPNAVHTPELYTQNKKLFEQELQDFLKKNLKV